jgi:hypothetical protein
MTAERGALVFKKSLGSTGFDINPFEQVSMSLPNTPYLQ